MYPNPEVSMITRRMFHSSRNLKQATQQPHTSQDKAEDPAVSHFTRAGLKALSYCHLRSLLSAMCISLDLWKAGGIFIAASEEAGSRELGWVIGKCIKGLEHGGQPGTPSPKRTELKEKCLGNSWFSTDVPWLTPPVPAPFPTPAISCLSKLSGSFPFCGFPVLVQARTFFPYILTVWRPTTKPARWRESFLFTADPWNLRGLIKHQKSKIFACSCIHWAWEIELVVWTNAPVPLYRKLTD